VWQLAGDHWMRAAPGRALQLAAISHHERATIVPPNSNQPQTSGSLVITIDGHDTPVASQVNAIAAIPNVSD
jgi:hypothetical protein